MTVKTVDVLLVGAGAMSSTLAMLLKQLDPSLKIAVVERLKPLLKKVPMVGITQVRATPPTAN